MCGVLKKYSRSPRRTHYFLEIIYEDKDIIAVNKPAGLIVHPDEHHKSGSLIQELVKKFPEIKNIGDDPSRPGVVHRLDKETSGVLIIARNNKSFDYLKKRFKDKKIKKTYLALIYGQLGKRIGEKGVIDLPIARSAKTPLLRTARGKTRGELKEAVTEYKIIEYFPRPELRPRGSAPRSKLGARSNFTLIETYPKTGRTHQIRAHLTALGHPVVCDKLYAKKLDCPSGLDRHFLHAYNIELTLPSGTRIKLEAELPDDLKKMLQKLGEYDKNDLWQT